VRALGVLAVAALLFLPASSSAATSKTRAGVFTGYAFDACSAPSTASLTAWGASPYRGLGIYIGGVNRACKQPNLNASWVQSTLGLGWSLLPLYVGLQAPCVSQSGLAKVSTNTTTAGSQGRAAADDAAAQAAALGLPTGSPVWFDMEGYKPGNAPCTKSVQSFVNAWNVELRARGFVPGVYGSAASTIRDVDALGAAKPDVIWIANWNGVEDVFGDQYISDADWSNHQRVHQYKGGHRETYGGVTINIDSNVVDSVVVGGGASPTPPPPPPPPTPVGQVNAGDGLSTVSWPAGAFVTDTVVTLTPMATPPSANGYGVQLTASQASDSAPVDGFGAPLTLHILKPAAGLVPAYSSDGTTWTPLPKLTAAGLTDSVLSAYRLDPDGTAEIETLVPGYFGLIADTTPPTVPAVSAKLVTRGLYLSWQPSTDDSGVSAYTILRNGTPIESVAPPARRATIRKYGAGRQTVYRIAAADAAGNTSAPSRPVVVLAKARPAKIPRAIPHWAFGLYAYQHGHGKRPKTAPKRPPGWYWTWVGWHALPYRLR
jgi:hypothetical protein